MTIQVPILMGHDSIYVADMTQHAALDETYEGLIELEAPTATATADLLASTAFTAGSTYTPAAAILASANFGRTVKVTSSANGTITLYGRDYLNQPMTQTVTYAGSAIETTKAFKYIDRVVSGTIAGNVQLGKGTAFGMPFCVADIIGEYADEEPASAPAHVAPVTSTPSATTGDTRGTVVPTTTPNGAKRISLQVRFTPNLTGGLYGPVQA